MIRVPPVRPFPAIVLLALGLSFSGWLGLQACSIAASDLIATVDRRPLLLSLRDTVIIPTVERFSARAVGLESAAAALAANPTSGALDSARTAWKAAALGWAEASALRFGPTADLFARIGFWPTRPNLIEQGVAAAYALDSARFAGLTAAAAKGLPALEWLLFSLPADSTLAALADSAKGPRRRAYLAGAAAELRVAARTLAAEWNGPAGTALADPVSGSRFPTTQMAVEELIKGLVASLEEMKNGKVLTPSGAKTEGRAQPEAVEAPYSGYSLALLGANLNGVEAAFKGSGPAGTGTGLNAYMTRLGSDVPARVDAGVAATRSALGAVPSPLSSAVIGQPAKVAALGAALTDLVVTVKNDVASTLGFNITFTDNDGD